jgi:DNA-binding beta-propeller fold protein YncE
MIPLPKKTSAGFTHRGNSAARAIVFWGVAILFYVASPGSAVAGQDRAKTKSKRADNVGKQGKTAQAGPYHLVKTVPVGGEGTWDYLTVDSDARRLYVSRATHTLVLDADKLNVIADIPDTPGVHGIAIATEFGRGFISNGRGGNVTIFDLKTLKATGSAKTSERPDAIIYDPESKRVFAFNAGGKNATVIDAATGNVIGEIPLGGKPEFAAADGDGHVYVNIEDTSEVVDIDSKNMKELHRWKMSGCEEPSGMAMDVKNRRLFSVCGNKVMKVVNADNGHVVATVPIGSGPDAADFDPAEALAFSSNGEGTLTIVHEDSPDKYTVAQTVPTKRGARTMAVDKQTHNIFLATAEFEPLPAGEKGRPKMVPNTFQLLVVGK